MNNTIGVLCPGIVSARCASEVAGHTDIIVHCDPLDIISEATITVASDSSFDHALAIGKRVFLTIEVSNG